MENILLVLRYTKPRVDTNTKYNGIMNAFRRKGYDVWVTYIDEGIIYLDNGKIRHKLAKAGNMFSAVTHGTALYSGLIKFLKKTDLKFKYCYIRNTPYMPGYIKMLKLLQKKGVKVAVEIATYPATSEINSEKFVKRTILKALGTQEKRAAKYVDAYLPMGEETNKIYNRPAVNIKNGIDTDILSMRHYSPMNDGVHLVAIARFARWHGYDRVIKGMKVYYEKNPQEKVFLHLVGFGDALEEYKRLTKEYNLSEYVFFEGKKYGDEANAYFDMADVAIASLNIKGYKVVYPLKIVEYIARGIPFIYADVKCQVKPEWDFCMKVSNDLEPIDIEKVVEFSKKCKSMENISERIREVAKKECSWDEEIEKMLNFFEK